MGRIEKAKGNFYDGRNCCQSVVSAYSDLFGLDQETALRISEPLGAGMGRMRLTCGAVSGMFMLAGLMLGKGSRGTRRDRGDLYEEIRWLANGFRREFGSIICGDLLGINPAAQEGSMPEERTEAYYKKRPCVECIGKAAALFEELAKKYHFPLE